MLSGRSIEAHKSDCPVLPTEIYVIVAWKIAYTAQNPGGLGSYSIKGSIFLYSKK